MKAAMRRPTRRATTLVPVAIWIGLLAGCGSDGDDEGSTDVELTTETAVSAGPVEVVLPAGAASGGTLAVHEGPEPENVPEGVVPLGASAVVSLVEGSLEGTMEVSFEPPPDLAAEQVPVVMAKDSGGQWQWRPTTWAGASSPVTADLAEPGQVFLARFDRTPWVADLVREFDGKVNNPSKPAPPTCGDEATPVENGLQLSSEPGDVLLWCAGIDTIESTPGVADADVDYTVEGVQATVLRLRNSSRMFQEVGYPSGWLPVDGSGRGALAGQALRERLGLAGTIRDGLSSRVLAPRDTLTLLLPSEPTGTVTADLSAAAWTLSALDFATNSYSHLVAGVDEELGDAVRAARNELMDQLAAPSTVAPADAEALEELAECLAPVSEVIAMNPDAAQQLVQEALGCTPTLLRSTLTGELAGSASVMADGVASTVLDGLPSALEAEPGPWAPISDTLTDAGAGFQVWVGPPPAQEHDYSDVPHVYRPGDQVAVGEWSTEFAAYVEERLAALPDDGSVDGSCTEGAFSVSRYRTDGFALAGLVTCAGEPWRLVLARTDSGWEEVDAISQDEHFGCAVLGTYSVPVFIAGDSCLDSEQTQEYTG